MKTTPITKVTGLILELTLEEARRLRYITARYSNYTMNWGVGNKEDQEFADSLANILTKTIEDKS